jgi:short-subunit dehydrogenase
LTQNVNVPQPDMLSVEKAAEKILWAIERKRAFYAFPWRSAWRVWLVRWLPARWGDAVVRALLARLAKREGKT